MCLDYNKQLILENIKNNEKNNKNNIKKNNYTNKVNNNDNLFCNLNNKSLERKLQEKRLRIKNLEEKIILLTKENQNLKGYINELESKIEIFNINCKENIIDKNEILIREQEMLNKINSLTKEIQEKNIQIEKMQNENKLKIEDIMSLKQKYQDLELIIKEKTEKLSSKHDKSYIENNDFKSQINNSNKILLTINYFIKKIYNMIPSLYSNDLNQSINDSNELQKHLICIENFISEYIVYNSNKKSKFFYDFEYNSKKNKIPMNRDEDKEKEELEKKINEINEQNIFLLKEIQSQAAKKIKKRRKINSSYKNKKENSKIKLK